MKEVLLLLLLLLLLLIYYVIEASLCCNAVLVHTFVDHLFKTSDRNLACFWGVLLCPNYLISPIIISFLYHLSTTKPFTSRLLSIYILPETSISPNYIPKWYVLCSLGRLFIWPFRYFDILFITKKQTNFSS